jgi:HD-like signal output (HDOD) protein
MKRILFVDDEPKVLQGLQRMLRHHRGIWEMEFAEGGQPALRLLEEKPFDVVVSDMMMPGMDGAQLLTEVMGRFPQTVRIVLSGHSNQEANLRLVGPAHQYLSKPCDPEHLTETVRRACALRDLLADAQLKRLVSQLKSLPSLPDIYVKVMNEMQKDEPSLARIGELISFDIAMSVKILQLVNSAFFGLPREVNSPAEAVVYLGVETVKALVLSVKLFSQFENQHPSLFSVASLWEHSHQVALVSRMIATEEKLSRQMINQAFIAGLLHDIGRLVLVAGMPKQYEQIVQLAKEQQISLWEAEKAVLGATHAEVGAYLLGLWGLPNPVVEAVALHHRPAFGENQELQLPTIIHVANALVHERDPFKGGFKHDALDGEHLRLLMLDDLVQVWRQMSKTMGTPALVH